MNFAGSIWWKFDFHAHTPKSDDYGQGDESLKNITPEEWLLDHMKAEIDCVAVTDHNSGEWIDVLKNAYQSLEQNQPDGFRQLFIFPGVEVAVSGGVHILAILDTDKSSSDVYTLLGNCGYKGKTGTCTSKSIVEVIKEIESFGAIAIPAHVDQNAGLFSQINGDTLKNVINLRAELYCVELVDKEFTLPDLCKSEKARWSFICGSDSHLSNEVGRRYTYVKMGKPCLEGLKLALMDGGDFSLIRFDETESKPNSYADFIIKSLEIKDARYCGNGSPLHIGFNPWLNCFIGGRGSGKSTIIEFLRIVMRREKEIEVFGEDSDLLKTFRNFSQVPKKRGDKGALREKTAVIAECISDDATFLVKWDNDDGVSSDSILEKQSDGTLKPSPGEIPVRFPIRIYSQKQMFEIASNPEALLDIIDESHEVGYRGWKTTHDRICAQYRSMKSRCREFNVQIKEEDTLLGELEDIKRKLRLFEQDENTHIRKEYQKKRSQEKEIELFLESLQNNNELLQSMEIETITPRSELFSDSEDALAVNNLFDEYIAKTKTINDELSRLKTKVQILSEDFSAEIETSVWKKNLQLSLKTYTDLNEKLKAEGLADPNEYGRLIQQKQIIESKIETIKNLKTAKENIEKQADDESEKLLKHRKELTVRRKQFISTVSENNSIRIEIEECADKKNLEKSFRSLIGLEDYKFQNDIENMLSGLSAEFDFEKLSALKKEIRKLKSDQSGRAMADKRFLNYIQRTVTEEMLDAVDLWYPDDNLVISYKRETGKSDFISIEQGSPGQKTAAILAFLLSYGKEPMILDQPEDDLDNHLIFDLVVRQLRENKKRRQIIIVTHNPNIVVNGDAEMVHVLDFKDGQSRIIEKGCLQEKNVRAEICKIMEGGKTAFEQRFRRINI